MLFNSFNYLFIFLPLTVIVYFGLHRARWALGAKIWLLGASLFFYAYWNPVYLPLILCSIVVNYVIGGGLGPNGPKQMSKRFILTVGIVFNLSLLGYFKYADFFIANINRLTGGHYPSLQIILPLAISFFTFQQIAYIVDSYYNAANERQFLDYALFVSFFPQLIAGPIVHHKEMMWQFKRLQNHMLSYENLSRGLYIFLIGLFKKVVIADNFGIWADNGFADPAGLSFLEAWATSLCYTFQLYFDFSGYTDMAIGAALMININLPINFNSPYKAVDLIDFWRRWHMTLGRFLKNYLYIPLGGNRHGPVKTICNLMITFLLGGIWHGAGWTFAVWGGLHGMGTVINRLWRTRGVAMPKPLAWLMTFIFVNMAWVIFRADTLADAVKVLSAMAGAGGNGFGLGAMFVGRAGAVKLVFMLALFLIISVFTKNSNQLKTAFKPTVWHAAYLTAISLICFVALFYLNVPSEFLYFQF
jgi:alginate O-acetyltransferase complex protein AlgI